MSDANVIEPHVDPYWETADLVGQHVLLRGLRADDAAGVVGQALGHPVAHCSDQRMRGAQIDADGDASLVRVGRLARFGNLQKCHVAIVPRVRF